MSESTISVLPEPVNELIAIFKEDLSSVAFPDITLEILEKLVLEVQEQEHMVEEAKKQVEQAQQALDASTENLLQKCMRGVAYAKIFAEGDEMLSARLSAINLGKTVRAPKRAAIAEKAKPRSVTEKRKSNAPEETNEEAMV